jgi:opacity protein-like surface antigen
MKKVLVLAMIALSITASAFANDIDDIFVPGDGEFKFERFSNEGILLSIDRDARVACHSNGQCTLSSVQADYKGWEVSFNFGQGGNLNSNGGTTIITGGYDSGKNDCNTCNAINWGLTLTYKKGQCSQQVMVPRSLYYSMNRYLYGLMQETGETRKGFTPADEAMIMFYSTIMKQASSSGCSSK